MLLLAAGAGQEDATQLTQRILTAGSPYEQVLERDLLLAGECLAWGAEVRPGLRHAILDRSLELYLRQVAFEADGASQGHVVHVLGTTFGLLGEDDRDYLLAALLEAARPDDAGQRFVPGGFVANLASAPRRLVSLIRDMKYYAEAGQGKYRADA